MYAACIYNGAPSSSRVFLSARLTLKTRDDSPAEVAGRRETATWTFAPSSWASPSPSCGPRPSPRPASSWPMRLPSRRCRCGFSSRARIGVGLALALGQSWRLTPAQWRATVIFGICQNALYLGLNFVAMQTVEASLAAIIASTLPLLVAVAAWAIFKRKAAPARGRGPGRGLHGRRAHHGKPAHRGRRLPRGDPLRPRRDGADARHAVGSGRHVGRERPDDRWAPDARWAPPSSPPWRWLTETLAVSWTWLLVAAFAYTTLVPGLAATVVWFMLVNRIGATRAATFHFLNPFFGVAVAALPGRDARARRSRRRRDHRGGDPRGAALAAEGGAEARVLADAAADAPVWARSSSNWSSRTQAIIASPTGTARMPTQGS
jgi:probable blue pigment (indigoidine) exporter